jgi:AraC-like DNA-binding protein
MEMEERALTMIHHLTGGESVFATASRCSPAWRRLAEDARYVLATRYAERLTIADLAVACKSSPFHLSRVFRAVYGVTLHRQLNRLRLRASLFELRHGSDDLVRIALDAGFSSHSHFRARISTGVRRDAVGVSGLPSRSQLVNARTDCILTYQYAGIMMPSCARR